MENKMIIYTSRIWDGSKIYLPISIRNMLKLTKDDSVDYVAQDNTVMIKKHEMKLSTRIVPSTSGDDKKDDEDFSIFR